MNELNTIYSISRMYLIVLNKLPLPFSVEPAKQKAMAQQVALQLATSVRDDNTPASSGCMNDVVMVFSKVGHYKYILLRFATFNYYTLN